MPEDLPKPPRRSAPCPSSSLRRRGRPPTSPECGRRRSDRPPRYAPGNAESARLRRQSGDRRRILLRPGRPVAGETRVDEPRVPGTERLVVHAEGGELPTSQVGDEDVGTRGERLGDGLPLGMTQIADDSALAAVVELESGVDVRLVRDEAGGGEPAQWI